MRFGMFIHWGPVSLTGREIGWSRGKPTPTDECDRLYERFDPRAFDADEWVRIAKAAGMKYLVFTAKHHDGFSMWDTKQSAYNIARSPFRRDVVRELSAACARAGLMFGVYYSILDVAPTKVVRQP
jgi:alpha-L-fucosidase